MLAILLLALEGMLRVLTRSGALSGFPLCPIDPGAPARAARGLDFSKTYLVFDRDLGWVVGPSRHSRNGLYESTALGARRTSDEPEERPGEPVLALSFGDSFTHGDDVPREGTWQYAVAKRSGGAVVNLGVPGYGLDQALLRYRRIGPTWPCEIVWIGLMADNIGRHLNRYRPFLSPEEALFFAKPRFELADQALRLVAQPFEKLEDYFAPDLDSRLAKLAEGDPGYVPSWYRPMPLDFWRTARAVRTLVALRESRRSRWRSLYSDPAATEVTRRIAVDFAAAVRADGRRPVVVFFPDRTFLQDVLDGRDHLAAPLLRRLQSDGIEVVDTTPALADFVRAGNPIAAQFIPHYSARMNERVASLLAERLAAAR
jgi:hypothetical protein